MALLINLAGVAACAGGAASPVPSQPPGTPSSLTSSAPAPGGPGQSPRNARHVFVIVMENQSPAAVLSQPYEHQLAQQFAVASNYSDVAHPSLPNYLALTSGSTWGIRDDGYHPLPRRDIGTELTASGVSWRAYMESMDQGCRRSSSPYAVKHNPFAYYGGDCPANVVDLSALQADLGGVTPRFVWITPNLCNDDHDCSPATGDRFLARLVPGILASAAWRDDGVLFIVWDEGGAGSDQVAALAVAPNLASHRSDRAYNHYSLLAAMTDRLGVPRLGAAAGAQALTDLLPA